MVAQDFLRYPINSASDQFEFKLKKLSSLLFLNSDQCSSSQESSSGGRSHSISTDSSSSSEDVSKYFEKTLVITPTINEPPKLVIEPTLLLHKISFTREKDSNFYLTSRGCIICRLNFNTETLFQDHIQAHGDNNVIPLLDKKITKSHFKLSFEVKDDSPDVNLIIENISDKELEIERIFLIKSGFIKLCRSVLPTNFKINEKCCFDVDRQSFRDENHTYPIVINFLDTSDSEYIEQHNLIVKESILQKAKKIVPILKRKKELVRNYMPAYLPSQEMKNLFHNKFEVFHPMTVKDKTLLDEINFISEDPKCLTEQNYTTNMSLMVNMEDLQVESDMYAYDMENVIFTVKNKFYYLNVEHLEEGRPSLLEKDALWILPMSKSTDANKGRINGYIYRIERDNLLIDFKEKKKSIDIDISIKYRVHFVPNRVNIQMQQHALAKIQKFGLSKYFFPEKPNKLNVSIDEEEFDWFNNNIQSNPEQKQAVTNIVRGTSFPAPYILFGPPGTGKTMTIVETVCQLWKLKPKSNILISTSSNSACNEIAIRLLKYIPTTDIYRLFAGSQSTKIDLIDDDLIDASNLQDGDHFYPCLEDLYQFRIILCTLCVAGRLGLADIDPKHFSHVFIDECGSASEPEALIPIVGIITEKRRMLGSIILAGDPKQLGPIMASEKAAKMGLGVSFLERLMDHHIYEKNADTNLYNTDLITKLVRNFRSHPKILKLPSDMFYDGDLLALGFTGN